MASSHVNRANRPNTWLHPLKALYLVAHSVLFNVRAVSTARVFF
jgi:hypothetical protein